MKNLINYYYNIIVNEFKKRENSFVFYIDDYEFEFTKYYGDVNKLLYIYSIVKSYTKEIYEIVFNNKNEVITYYENIPYILLKKNIKREMINLNDIVNYDTTLHVEKTLNWKKLWVQKLDYYEMQIEEIGIKYPLLKQSFNYFLGLSEIAINLLNYVDYNEINNYISHRRLEKADDLFNPLNIIIDNKTRDIAEYIKKNFFYNEINEEKIIEFISTQNFSNQEIILFISRLLYPSYYFDLYEEIYNNKDIESEIKKIIKKNDEYEDFLKKIYTHVKFLYNIIQIEFLEY